MQRFPCLCPAGPSITCTRAYSNEEVNRISFFVKFPRFMATKTIRFECSCFWTPIVPNGASRVMEFSNNTTGIAATTASNGTTSSQAAPHNKNTAQLNRSDSPYQGRTAQKDNPNRSGLWGVLWLLIASTGNTVFVNHAARTILAQGGRTEFFFTNLN